MEASELAKQNGGFHSPSQSTSGRRSSGFVGKHRLQASISRLELQIRVIEHELQELDTIGGASTVCDEFIAGVESSPDPLLPLTRGPADVSWDRWFGAANGSRRHRRWI